MMTWAEQDMNDSRRLVVVVAQADAQRCTVAVCHGLYSTTEPIGAISALTRGSLHATAVAKTAQSSKTRVMGTLERRRCCHALSPLRACGSLASGGNRSGMHACHHITMPTHTLQYIRNSSIELLLGTHAGCSGRPRPYNETLDA